jgi:hypothetical protein
MVSDVVDRDAVTRPVLPSRRVLLRTARGDERHASGEQLRHALLDQGVLAEEGPHLRFTEEYVFTSPSTAAMVVMGRTANGRIEWTTPGGRTLKELQAADSGEEPS